MDPNPAHIGSRLITQTMILSADRALQGGEVRATDIRNVGVLIGLVCLYDRLLVLSTQFPPHIATIDSPLVNWLIRRDILRIAPIDEAQGRQILAFAQSHWTSSVPSDQQERVRVFAQDSFRVSEALAVIERPERDAPDESLTHTSEHMTGDWGATALTAFFKANSGSSRVLAEAKKHYLEEGWGFVLRSFLYLSFADAQMLPYCPDSERASFTATVARSQYRLLREALSESLNSIDALRAYPSTAKREALLAPFAATVFNRAQRGHKLILPNLKRLRHEMAGLRRRLRLLEADVLWGSRSEAQRALKAWNASVAEVSRAFGEDPSIVTFNQGLSVSRSLPDDPTKWSQWAKLVRFPVEAVQRHLSRRPVVEIHDLRRQLPASGTLFRALNSLFGPEPVRELFGADLPEDRR